MKIISEDCKWKEFPKNMNNKLHSICGYMAMFPPSLPHYFIDKYSSEGDIVLDAFSGRGTTLLESCFMKRIGIGNDKNPLAYLLTKSKSNIPQKGRIISKINLLEKEFYKENGISIKKEDKNIKMIFSPYTLRQLLFLKNKLKWKNSNVDSFITSMIVGRIHGSSKGFLSLKMPNTFSMSPNYVRKYIKEHNLKKPKRDVFKILKDKLERCYQKPETKGYAYKQDVRKMTKIKDSSVDLIITSPPYTRVIRYGQFNWIRLWFLNNTGKEIDKKLFFTQSIDKYSNFMSDALHDMKRVLKESGKIVLVLGDVKDKKKDYSYNLAETIWDRCAKPLGFNMVESIREDVIGEGNKVSRIWGDKRGNATKIDRILVLENN